MLYQFIKKDGNVIRIGDIDALSIQEKLQNYFVEGYEYANAEEHDAQVIGAVNKQLDEALAKLEELGKPTEDETAL